MYRISLPILAFAIAVLPGCGSSIGPVIELESEDYNFGVVRTDEINEAEFKIYNRGDETLKLYDVVTSCTCTTGELVDKSIPPGGEGTMIIRLDPRKMSGTSTRMPLGIKSNDPNQEIVKLPVEGWMEFPLRVVSDGDVEQTIRKVQGMFVFANIDMGDIALRKGIASELSVRMAQNFNRRTAPTSRADVSLASGEGSIVTELEVGTVPPQSWADPDVKEFDLKFTFYPDVAPGEYAMNASVYTNNDRFQLMNFRFDIAVGETGDASVVAKSGTPVRDAPPPEEVVDDVALDLVGIVKERESSYAVRIASESAERWYNVGGEFDGFVLDEILPSQGSIIVRETESGRRLRVTRQEDKSSVVTLIP